MEKANSYFIWSLENSTGADGIRSYLNGRGYTQEEIKAMEIGYIPSQEKLYSYLIEQGHSSAEVKDILDLSKDTRIGSSHKITIPYRSGGQIKGFKFRAIDPQTNPKYLNSPGTEKRSGFFNLSPLKGDKDLTIVEGEIDALHATIKGIPNVVATGGSDIHPEQIEDAKKKGAKMFTLCFDREPGAEAKVLKALDTIRKADEEVKIYVATLPDLGEGKTDPDRLVKERGAEALREAVKQAVPDYEYRLRVLMDSYDQDKELTPKEVDNFREEVTRIAYSIKKPLDQSGFIKSLEDRFTRIGITREAMEEILKGLRYRADQEKQKQETKKLLSEASALIEKGETGTALTRIIERARELTGIDQRATFEDLLKIPTEAEIMEAVQSGADAIETGLTLIETTGGKMELTLPSGALTIIAGRTSHRKTGLMLNLAINTALKHPDREVHLFSYEESREALLIKLLNIYINYPKFKSDTTNLKFIEGYFKSGGGTYRHKEFLEGKERFFRELINSGRLRIHYSPLKVEGLTGAIRYLTEKGRAGAIFVDYIQELRINGNFQSRQLQLQEICEQLRETAIETRLPVILGAQFNRTVTMEGDLDSGNIREAGDIEQTANMVIGLWDRAFTKQGGVKGKEQKDRRGDTARHEPGILYIEVLKGRDIGVGAWAELRYNGETGKIRNRNQWTE
jgi:DNA primase